VRAALLLPHVLGWHLFVFLWVGFFLWEEVCVQASLGHIKAFIVSSSAQGQQGRERARATSLGLLSSTIASCE
jgi:hypothetical protein